MKITKPLILIVLLFIGCETPQKEEQASESSESNTETVEQMASIEYPDLLRQALDAHGGLEKWQEMQSMYFEIPGEDGSEKHYISLDKRHDRVENSDATMGYNGEQVWIVADTTYKRDPIFYHNLMFYFYAMPFVLSDPGIIYGETMPLEHEGVSYPGVAIAYEDGVGASSKDEYFIYFDPESGQMAWLGYTVTYFSGEKSEKVSWIRYHDWQSLDGLLLPKAISWYHHVDGVPTDLRNTVEFEAVTISNQPQDPEMFNPPPEARVIEG